MNAIATGAKQLLWATVGTDARQKATMAATAMNAAVHAPCSDSAFRHVETDTKAEPAVKM